MLGSAKNTVFTGIFAKYTSWLISIFLYNCVSHLSAKNLSF